MKSSQVKSDHELRSNVQRSCVEKLCDSVIKARHDADSAATCVQGEDKVSAVTYTEVMVD